MARTASSRREVRLDNPKGLRTNFAVRLGGSSSGDRFGRFSESFARAMGTTYFLVALTVCVRRFSTSLASRSANAAAC